MNTAPKHSTNRLMSIDAGRVLATFAIVWVHASEAQGLSFAASALGRFGTSFYVIVAAFFASRSIVLSPHKSFTAELYKKTQRLLRPYLIWSLVYAVLYTGLTLNAGASLKGLTQWWGPFAGTAVHLWFLPFVFVWSVVALVLVPLALKFEARTVLILGGVVSCALYYYCYRHLFFSVDRAWLWSVSLHRLDRWIVEVPLFFSALTCSVYFYKLTLSQRERLQRRQNYIAVVAGAVFVGSELLYATHVDAIRSATMTEGRFMGNFAGAAILAGFLAKNQSRIVTFLSPLGRYTYVAFLGHIVVLELTSGLLKSIPGYGTLWFCLASSLGIFGASLGLSFLIARVRFLSFLRA